MKDGTHVLKLGASVITNRCEAVESGLLRVEQLLYTHSFVTFADIVLHNA